MADAVAVLAQKACKLLALTPGIGVAHQAKVAVGHGAHGHGVRISRGSHHLLARIAQGGLTHVACIRAGDVAQEVDAALDAVDFCLVRVQAQCQVLAQEIIQQAGFVVQAGAIVAQDHHVIDVAHVLHRLELVFGKLVRRVHVDVGEELATQVANGQAVAVGIEQAFVAGNLAHQPGRAAHLHICGWVVVQHAAAQVHPPGFRDVARQQRIEDGLLDADKEVRHVRLEVERGHAVILAGRAHEVLQPIHRTQRAFARDAGVAVMHKAVVEARANPVVQQVMHHAVTEISGPDLAHLGVLDHKADGLAGLVRACVQLVIQIHQVSLKSFLKRQGVEGVALGFSTVKVSLKKLRDSHVALCLHCFLSPDSPHIVGIRLIVVVLVAGVRRVPVLVPGVRR